MKIRFSYYKPKVLKALFQNLILALLVSIGIIMILPFSWMVLSSFKPESEFFVEATKWLPQRWTLDNYFRAFKQLDFPIYFRNTIIYAGSVALTQMLLASLAGYAFARLRFGGRDFFFMLILSTMMIPYQCRIIPTFIMLRKWPLVGGNNIFGVGGTGFLDSFGGLILPSLSTAFGIFLLRQFFIIIPKGLEDAARIDGCSEFQIYWRIMLPLAKPALAVIALFAIQWRWNEFLWPLIITSSKKVMTLQVAIMSLKDMFYVEWGMLMASVSLVVFPLIIVFFFTQKYFVRGIVLTGMKG